MSNALAIASVSAVLKDLLNNAAIDHQLSNVVGEVKVSALPPDRVLVEGTPETSRINLFLYQVTPNQGWRNVDLPSRDSSGERTASPPLALDLHYLLSAYGASEFHAEILLGYAACSCSTRRRCSPATRSGGPSPQPRRSPRSCRRRCDTLTASELADQVEQIRVTPETDEPRGDLAAVGGHPVPLPADGRVPGVGGAHRVAPVGALRRCPSPTTCGGST